jgi:hypothetical protein
MKANADRRGFLRASVGLTGVALALPAGTAEITSALDLRDPKIALEAYVKLRGSTADETVFQPYEGDIFLMADGHAGQPLCGFNGVQKSVWRRDDKGGFSHTDYDLGFYVDYESREILKTWNNPLTGKTVEVFHYRGGPSGGRFAVGNPSTDVYGGPAGRWSKFGDQLWHTASSWGERPNPMSVKDWPLASSGERLFGSMSLSFAGRVSEVADPKIHRPQSLQLWTNATAFMPWMEMAQRPGGNLWRWIGAKGVPASKLPDGLA